MPLGPRSMPHRCGVKLQAGRRSSVDVGFVGCRRLSVLCARLPVASGSASACGAARWSCDDGETVRRPPGAVLGVGVVATPPQALLSAGWRARRRQMWRRLLEHPRQTPGPQQLLNYSNFYFIFISKKIISDFLNCSVINTVLTRTGTEITGIYIIKSWAKYVFR